MYLIVFAKARIRVKHFYKHVFVGMTHGRPVLFSQISVLSQADEEDPVKTDNCRKFQQKADEAGLVIFVLSLDFAQSKTSQMQVCFLVSIMV